VPYSAQIEVTLRCNANCPFCFVNSLPDAYINNEMNTEQIKSIIDQLDELGVTTLSLTGGEPTLRKDLKELVYYMGVEHNFINGITSNGLLLPKLIPKFEGLDFILTSIDYPTAEMHDRFRGIKLFDKVIEAINLANKKNIKVIISTVVMKGNLGFLEDICELAENLDCSIELYPCEDILWNVSDQILKVENVQELIPNLSQWANKIRDLRTKFRNILTDPISLDIIENGGFGGTPYYQDILRCNVAKNYMFIRHDGFIEFPCKLHPAKRFNVLNHSFSEIYKSKEVRDIMKLHDDYDFCKGCRLGCAVVSSLPSSWYALYSKYVRGFFSGNLR